MEEIKYKGSIISELYTLINKYPTYTFGQILHTIKQNHKGISLAEISDEAFYEAIEAVLKADNVKDEVCSEEEFKVWVESK